jgi:hypothetical protein
MTRGCMIISLILDFLGVELELLISAAGRIPYHWGRRTAISFVGVLFG